MRKKETVEAFYHERGIFPETASLVNVFENESYCNEPHIYNRRDFYKISLLQGKSRLSWHHHDIAINRPALVFFNPLTPFAWEPVSATQPGFFCLFRKEFLHGNDRNESIQNSPLFKIGSNPVFFLKGAQVKYISNIFRKMLTEIESDYVYKYDLLRSYLHLIIHEALKMEPAVNDIKHHNASERIASLFTELLERQFPIDAPDRSLKLKKAGDYAKALSIHVNHLNHALRQVSGKPTSAHISDRILSEAKALLKHTDWTAAEIGYSLGFEHPNYFYNFFKKKTGHPPKQSRSRLI
ncbi:MAG TPA: helix-turn-helix transcriptional regulator [Chitinophaga sp.]